MPTLSWEQFGGHWWRDRATYQRSLENDTANRLHSGNRHANLLWLNLHLVQLRPHMCLLKYTVYFGTTRTNLM